MRQPALLAIDQGTSSSRAIVFTLDAVPLVVSQKELASRYGPDGWVEQDPEEIWRTTLETCREAVGVAQDRGLEITAAGIANQRETTVVWERSSGRPVYNAIVWQDRRGAGRCSELRRQGLASAIVEATGLVPDSYFSATKLQWLLEHVEDADAAAATGKLAFGTIDSFLLWRLTGGRVHATDATNASRTMLFNIATQQWDLDLLELFRVPRVILPEVRDSVSDYGTISADLLGAEIPIRGIAGDQQAAAVGQTCFKPGMAKCTYGTGAFLLINVGGSKPKPANGLLGTVGSRLAGETSYAIEGTIFNAGSTIQWLSETLRLVADPVRSSGLAATVKDSGGVVLVPAFTGLGAPHWDPEARGGIFGLSRDTTPAHIVRAGLEAVAYQTHDLLEAAGGLGQYGRLRVDGAMAKNDWLMQFLSDVLGVPVERPAVTETTALGAAFLAGLGAGTYDDTNAVGRLWKEERCFTPSDADCAPHLTLWQEAVRRVRKRPGIASTNI
ncbi:MAG: glycerol kinase GlpK [Rhodospirillales bacterium]|nr:glycerol kinase GlpK [Rhodospirillales bacterium]